MRRGVRSQGILKCSTGQEQKCQGNAAYNCPQHAEGSRVQEGNTTFYPRATSNNGVRKPASIKHSIEGQLDMSRTGQLFQGVLSLNQAVDLSPGASVPPSPQHLNTLRLPLLTPMLYQTPRHSSRLCFQREHGQTAKEICN